jgi:cell wall-associated NlpC family hydrolase
MERMPTGHACRRTAVHALCVLAVAALGSAGCATTAPRFRSAGVPRAGSAAGTSVVPHTNEIPASGAVKPRPWEDAPLPPALNRDHLLLEIVSLLGVPYEYGGSDMSGIDCSAFTEKVYGTALHVPLPRSTVDQFREGADVARERLRFGDLVFFNTTGETPSHVGIYIEDDLFAHASVTYGVTISSLENSYYRDRFVGARRIIQ